MRREPPEPRRPEGENYEGLELRLLLIFTLFEHVLDRRLIDHQVRLPVITVHFNAVTVIPLDDAVNFLAVAENNHHGCPRLHLLLVVEIFGVGLLRRRCFLSCSAAHGTIATLGSVDAFGTIMPLRTFATLLYRDGRCIMIPVILGTRQRWPDQFAVREIFPVGGVTHRRWSHHNILHVALPQVHAFAQTTALWDLIDIDQRRRELFP